MFSPELHSPMQRRVLSFELKPNGPIVENCEPSLEKFVPFYFNFSFSDNESFCKKKDEIQRQKNEASLIGQRYEIIISAWNSRASCLFEVCSSEKN